MAQELIQNGQLDRQAAVEALREFLEKTVRAAGFQLQVKVSVAEPGSGDAEVLADVDGRDKEILLERGAEVLKAALCGWSRNTTRRFTSIAAVTGRCDLKSCA